ncbi:DUF2909 family protein [Bermanella marisrubri]|uniref:HIG1 domain-containing protein n=1 Tax=Bermanella marisrubri TaxID=207949 RepID=Q1N2M7_9GAMM|nr:DUF2909 family protein [Bermanella marisrubri]EAT12380.1 hypothetical protein RED65_16121 [Oceanobacter sp. RED65] [Bermanella marisrubri]QIZ85463.1 DUF2909 family protein [Bermanella marisrubri]
MLELIILLFLLCSIVALFIGMYHLVTSKNSSVKTYQSLKYRVFFAAMALISIAILMYIRHG